MMNGLKDIETVVEVMDRDNTEVEDRELIDRILSTEDEFLHGHFDRFFEYALAVAGRHATKMHHLICSLINKVLQSESRKYTLVMTMDKLTDDSVNTLAKYFLSLNAYLYVNMKNIDKCFGTVKELFERSAKVRSDMK